MTWTKEHLEEVARHQLSGVKLVVVANREPYIHIKEGEEIRCVRAAGGMVAALDPMMRACGGLWVGHGSGNADREVSDALGRLGVPPEEPAYRLRRIWLSEEEERGFYYGFSNEALWPLCHIAYTRPRFDPDHWQHYRDVNRKFADAVLEEVQGQRAVVFVQDYHFALLPRMLKSARPDWVILQFWHIPWPNQEVFRICPWQEEILDGLLGNDILSFHLQHHCNNFLNTVAGACEARVDWEHFAVTRSGKQTLVQPQPISIDPDAVTTLTPEEFRKEERRFRGRLRLGDLPLLVGFDRVDYTKGIPERFRAVDRLLELHPEMRGKFCFLQVGLPSRTHISAYRMLNEKLEAMAEEINVRYGDQSWRPIYFIKEHFTPEQTYVLYRTAVGCVVTSLHDGMNLVAKEFVAARNDSRGTLILSRFTGAARELDDALLVNPFHVDEIAEAVYRSLTMPGDEQEHRMSRMRKQVSENNIYRWAGMLLAQAGARAQQRSSPPAGKENKGEVLQETHS